MPGALRPDLDTFLSTAVFRANPQYELVLFDRLPPEQQAVLADLRQRPNFYGILRPVAGSGLSVKSVSRDTALLSLTMREAGTLPHYARPANENETTGIMRLVFDQILQVQLGDQFVSGAAAHELFYQPVQEAVVETRIQQLSIAALQYAQRLAVSDVTELSARLYSYNRIPVTSRWLEVFHSPRAVAERLGVAENGRYRRFLEQSWEAVDAAGKEGVGQAASGGGSGWLSWRSRHASSGSASGEDIHKLYVSPLPDFVENVFAVTVRTLATTAVLQLKIGDGAAGLLRPDKMVAYFRSFDELRTAADLLAARLDGCPAQGVPFTAQLAGDGLLSWGIDPPASERLLNWQPEESWRLWLTNRLANALLTARAAGSGSSLEPWQYALERLELEGIDTQSWTAARPTWAQ